MSKQPSALGLPSSRTKKQMARLLAGMYSYLSHSALALSFLEDGSPSAETCFDTERSACPQAAAFLSRRTRITPSTYVYTSFVSDLVLAKSVAVGKTPRQASLFDHLLYWPHIAWARCHHYQTESTLRTNRVHHFRSVPQYWYRAFSRFFSTAAR